MNFQAHQLLMNFEEPLKDYVRAVQSIKVSLACLLPSFSYLFTLLFFCVWVPARPLHLSLKLILLFCVFWQATIAERANVFRHQCELAETMKLKEINLYVLVAPFLLITLFYLWFRWYHVKSSRTLQDTEPWLFSWFLLLYSDRSLVVMT
jgi:hypothetical protein